MRVTPSCDSIHSVCISNAASVQKEPDVVFGAGMYFTVWADARSGSYWIFGARVSTVGTVLDPSGIAISIESGEGPSINYDGSRFLVVWSTTSAIKGAFCSPGGAPQQYITIASGGSSMYAPNMIFDGINYLVIWIGWTGSSYSIYGQLLSPSGSLVGSQFAIGTTSIAIKPGLCFDGNYYCISWTESNDIWARQYTTSGTPVGPSFIVSGHTDPQYFCDVSAGINNYLFTWGQVVSSDYDIYGNVDITIGVTEARNDLPENNYITSTIFTDSLHLLQGSRYKILDVTGRRVTADQIKPGVYFIEIDGIVTQKVIMIK